MTAEIRVEAAYDRRNAEELLQEDMTEEELEAYQNTVTTTLKSMKELEEQGNDIDSILASKEKSSLTKMMARTLCERRRYSRKIV